MDRHDIDSEGDAEEDYQAVDRNTQKPKRFHDSIEKYVNACL